MNNVILVQNKSDLEKHVFYVAKLNFITELGDNYSILGSLREHPMSRRNMSTVLANLSRNNQHKGCYTFTPIRIQEPREMA